MYKIKFLSLLFISVFFTSISKAQCPQATNLTTSFGNNVSNFYWDAVPGAMYYKIEVKPYYSNYWLELSSQIPTNSFSYPGFMQSLTINWRITTFCSTTDSSFSAVESYTVPCESPNTPTVTNITGTTARLNWIPAPVNSGQIPTFYVAYRLLGSTGNFTSLGSTTNNYMDVTGLQSNTSYEWCVARACSYFYGDPLMGTFTTAYIPCDIPVNLSSSNITSSSAKLSWNNVLGASNYLVEYRKVGNTNWSSVSINNNNVTISGLSSESLYEWRLKTNCTNSFQSAYSVIKQFHTYSSTCSSWGVTAGEWIDFVSLGTINRSSGADASGYFRSNQSTTLPKGSVQTISVSVGYNPGIVMGDYFAVYIDFNNNGSFADAGERVVAPGTQMNSSSMNYTASFTVPTNISTGTRKMRVIVRRPTSTIVPCGTGFQGEVEDYTVVIAASNSNKPEPTSMLGESEEGITIAPNPSQGRFIIYLAQDMDVVACEVIGLNGQVVYKTTLHGEKMLPVSLESSQARGMYLVRCVAGNGTQYVKRILVN
ncbi:MAG: fibronectin type III domain-containing protein [Chitinophagaceae bacterium]|nr:fibronectin type III domain-containing protein [Chitinophagaceae bacterium]